MLRYIIKYTEMKDKYILDNWSLLLNKLEIFITLHYIYGIFSNKNIL